MLLVLYQIELKPISTKKKKNKEPAQMFIEALFVTAKS